MYHVRYYHPTSTNIELCRHILVKIPKTQFKENNCSISQVLTCGDVDGLEHRQTDRQTEMENFADLHS
jgi:hypothetical protein